LGTKIYSFKALLAENGRLNRLSGVAQAFGKLMSAHKNEVSATVTSAKVGKEKPSLFLSYEKYFIPT
jgi:F0F1-type ATP synthase delta subunit